MLLDLLGHVRRGLLQVAHDPLERQIVVDDRPLEVVREEVADHPQRQLCFLVDEGGRGHLLGTLLDRRPEPLEELDVALDVLGRRTFGGGPDDQAALLRRDLLEDVA